MKNLDKCLNDIKKQCEKHGTIQKAARATGVTHLASILRKDNDLTDAVANKFGWEVITTKEAKKIK